VKIKLILLLQTLSGFKSLRIRILYLFTRMLQVPLGWITSNIMWIVWKNTCTTKLQSLTTITTIFHWTTTFYLIYFHIFSCNGMSKFLARVYQMSLYFNSFCQAQTIETTNFPTNICYTQGAFMRIKLKFGYVCIFFYYEKRTCQSMMCYWMNNEHNLIGFSTYSNYLPLFIMR
jgi:hypothetical protein